MAQPVAPPSIVVGIDGSRLGVRAALWAVPEAVGHDLPLRLVAAAEDGGAEAALSAAAAAVRQTGRPVTLSTEVIPGAPAQVLREASRGAVMLCIGMVGIKHFGHGQAGSTASALLASAHCPVALVRGEDRPNGWVVAELDQTPDSAAVLQYAVAEARMRGAGLRVLGTRRSEDHGGITLAEADRMIHAQLDRRLEQWRHRYPDLDVQPVAAENGTLGYLTENAESVQLVVIGASDSTAVSELLGTTGQAALHDTDCSILVVDRQRLL